MNIKYFYTILFLGLLVLSCTSVKEARLPEAESNLSADIPSTAPIETAGINTVHHELLMSGNNAKNGIDQTIREQGQLDNLYSILYGNNRKAPKIDFSRKAVIVLTCGPFNTGGYNIEIISAIKMGNSIELLWEVKTPEPWDIVTQAITRPYMGEVYNYLELLQYKILYKKQHEESVKRFPNLRPDILKQPNFYMWPAFDEPLEDFKEYM